MGGMGDECSEALLVPQDRRLILESSKVTKLLLFYWGNVLKHTHAYGFIAGSVI